MSVNRFNTLRNILLLLLLLAGFAAMHLITSCSPPPKTPLAPTPPGLDPSISPDAFVLLFTGNWAGHLEPCGCTDQQLGGIDRRTRTVRKIAPDPNARLLLDAGPLLDRADRQSQLKLATFLLSLKQLNYDAVCLSPRELLLLKEKLDLPADQLSPILCSNLNPTLRRQYRVRPTLSKTLRHDDYTLDCLVLALWDPRQLQEQGLDETFPLADPLETVSTLLAEENLNPTQPSADRFIVVLLPDASDQLLDRLRRLPALDLIITRGLTDEPERLNPQQPTAPLVVTTGTLGKYITRLDVPFDRPSLGQHLRFAALPIDSHFPRDPAIVTLIDDYQMRLQLENLIEDEVAIPRLPLPVGHRFLGSAACAGCHRGIYDNWKKFKHAHAIETLIRVNRQFDPECIVCHTIGFYYAGGYRSQEKTPHLADVGCEICHGPGSPHIDDSSAPYRHIFTSCETCHDHENSPFFDGNREKYFQNIKHWTEPRKYWK